MTRDLNDARVTFTALGSSYGLTLDQVRAMWRAVQPPYPRGDLPKAEQHDTPEGA